MLSVSNTAHNLAHRISDLGNGNHTRGVTTTTDSHLVTTVTSRPAPEFNLGTALRNTAIGGALGSALGGVAMLAKVSLPLLGKVTSVAGIAKFGMVGGAIGLATAVLPALSPSINDSPMLKAALTGASIGATAGMFLPLLSPVFGAIAGAAIGVGVHLWNSNRGEYYYTNERYPHPQGMPPGVTPPNCPPPGVVPPRPNLLQRVFGAPTPFMTQPYVGAGFVGSPYGSPYGAPTGGYYGPSMYPGYAPSPYGMLPLRANQPQGAGQLGQPITSPYGDGQPMISPYGAAGQPMMSPYGASPAAGQPALTPQMVTGTPISAAAAAPARKKRATRKAANRHLTPAQKKKARARKAAANRKAAAARKAMLAQQAMLGAQGVGMQGLTSPASYLDPRYAAMLPFAGGSPFAAGQQFQAMMPQMMNTPGIGIPVSGQYGSIPGMVQGVPPTLTGIDPATVGAPVLPAGMTALPALGQVPIAGLPGLAGLDDL